MKTVIHPDYAADSAFIRAVPNGHYAVDEVYCDHRNVVCRCGHYVIKRYKRPTWANCFIYTFFRKNKARRAYDNALHLLDMGFETPRPVAWIMKRRWGLVHTCWLITEYVPLHSLCETYRSLGSETERERLRQDFANYVLRLHENCIYHRDFNTSNILVRSLISGHYDFALIDINRMRFGRRPDTRRTLRALVHLEINLQQLIDLDERYAQLTRTDTERNLLYLLRYRSHGRVKALLHNWLKRILGIPPARYAGE